MEDIHPEARELIARVLRSTIEKGKHMETYEGKAKNARGVKKYKTPKTPFDELRKAAAFVRDCHITGPDGDVTISRETYVELVAALEAAGGWVNP